MFSPASDNRLRVRARKATALVPQRPAMARGLTLLFAVAGGAAVSNLYWAQPLLDFITRGLHASTATAGWLITATQVG